MAAHATEFFLGEGLDFGRPRELAVANVVLRPTGGALVMLARAELATGHPVAARHALERALATPIRSPGIVADLRELAAALGCKVDPVLASEARPSCHR